MATNWIRGKAERPEKRRIVLIYETGDAKNAALEQLLERIPYGHGNKTLLECLRVGAKTMLAQLGGAGGEQTARPAPAAQPAQSASPPPPAPVPSSGNGAGFSKSATRMFEMGDQKGSS
ncbi:MAG: hypothetical protein GAK28_04356 [Luteibacter sp.]|uniref:hypothetical protein n=1 Tax=Luteibacter sp. TaxID=1886636 RepID=UPI00137C41BF|nr:hypothetical protein [Luteibacter sp.]KAF1003893.1 MAG: hypothetical protein GAK28_04356 [Luteibacter sp.]